MKKNRLHEQNPKLCRRRQSAAWKPIMRSYVTNWMTSRRTPTKLDRFIAKRKSGWPCDACVIHARFARGDIINLATRRSAPRFARNNILVPVFFFFFNRAAKTCQCLALVGNLMLLFTGKVKSLLKKKFWNT